GGFTENKKKEAKQESNTSDNVVTQPENEKGESGPNAGETSEEQTNGGSPFGQGQNLIPSGPFTGSNSDGETYFEGVRVRESNLPFGSNRYSTPWAINVPAAYKYDIDLL